MKGSKWTWTVIVAAIALLDALLIFNVDRVYTWQDFFSDETFANDLRLRRNEVRCAHQGVNSFRIWNREISVPGFLPWGRPDKENLPRLGGDSRVHAYPPWHTAFFWFYGWLPELLCVSLMALFFGLCCCFVVHESIGLSRARFLSPPGIVVLFSLTMIFPATVLCFLVLNYGVLILTAFLLMNKALEKNHTVLAGLAWAVMMIKPQVGLLFVWPLFWHRHYLTIVTATVVCLAGTVFTSFAVHESPIDLILQIPEIGRPYGSVAVMNKIISPVLGDGAAFLVPAFFFVLVGFLTGASRKNRDFLVSCVPAILVIPLWTYSLNHDHVILLPAIILLIARIFATRRWNALSVLVCLYVVLLTLCYAWSLLAVSLKVFDPTGIGWIYRIAEYSSYAVMLAIAALFVRDSRPRRPAHLRLCHCEIC